MCLQETDVGVSYEYAFMRLFLCLSALMHLWISAFIGNFLISIVVYLFLTLNVTCNKFYERFQPGCICNLKS